MAGCLAGERPMTAIAILLRHRQVREIAKTPRRSPLMRHVSFDPPGPPGVRSA